VYAHALFVPQSTDKGEAAAYRRVRLRINLEGTACSNAMPR
jgi:hypothetical protein